MTFNHLISREKYISFLMNRTGTLDREVEKLSKTKRFKNLDHKTHRCSVINAWVLQVEGTVRVINHVWHGHMDSYRPNVLAVVSIRLHPLLGQLPT